MKVENARKMIKQGVVVSDKNEKTIVVLVQRQYIHPLYKKTVRRHKKFMAHDENNEAHEGDTVEICESRPMSARKRWSLHKIVERRK
ncbi:MAG: 30S ribosomal protein S17 [Candidatus Cloacimonadaceae bacterium]|nr:30S ribosomal protein S17 [Candidatus Cloacimonadota bacterium]MCB5254697.1 30S ribosomal protein S17 [Candidatus Cloacimonadota bacterium]MCK9177952.1 30S ribosomal protein S17 [Candidatus Cloacimonadota bacterium]MCK9243399.1 30S ribosomal protein S17 [Candidatus Cloacimonadota bacterium]